MNLIKKWLSKLQGKSEQSSERDIVDITDFGVSFIFALDEHDKPSVMYKCMPGKEEQAALLLLDICNGIYLPAILTLIEEIYPEQFTIITNELMKIHEEHEHSEQPQQPNPNDEVVPATDVFHKMTGLR